MDEVLVTGARVITPQFDRHDGHIVMAPPLTIEGYEALSGLSDDDKFALGLQRWDSAIWLFPVEWASSIPVGLKVVNLFHEEVVLEEPVDEGDRRFGVLAFGIRISKEEALENLMVSLTEKQASGEADFVYLWGLQRQLKYIGSTTLCQEVLGLIKEAERPDRYNEKMFQEFMEWLEEAATFS